MTISFSRPGQSSVCITPLPGSLETSREPLPPDSALVRQLSTAELVSGHCLAPLSSSFGANSALGMASPPGLGDYSISGLVSCGGALLDVSLLGDKLQLVRFSWKGIPN